MVLFLQNTEKPKNKIGSVILNMIYKKKEKYHQNKTKSSQEKSTNDVLKKIQKCLLV